MEMPNSRIAGFSCCLDCGAEGDRTPDLCIANAALSQLSYGPWEGEREGSVTVPGVNGFLRFFMVVRACGHPSPQVH
jgi:hypothetical protein